MGLGETIDVLNVVHNDMHMAEFIRTLCNMTLYPRVCVSSLSSYRGPLKPKKSDLVNVDVYMSLINAHNMFVWSTSLKTKISRMSKRKKAMLKDSMENFRTTTYQIHQSLVEMKHHLKRNTFNIQMRNSLTQLPLPARTLVSTTSRWLNKKQLCITPRESRVISTLWCLYFSLKNKLNTVRL
jgi:pectinesterase inhibitor-like protein